VEEQPLIGHPLQLYCRNDAVGQCPYFFILTVPNQFRYPVWGRRRLLT